MVLIYWIVFLFDERNVRMCGLGCACRLLMCNDFIVRLHLYDQKYFLIAFSRSFPPSHHRKIYAASGDCMCQPIKIG